MKELQELQYKDARQSLSDSNLSPSSRRADLDRNKIQSIYFEFYMNMCINIL